MKGTYDVLDIANYFLFKAEKDEELLSNLKLQKLLYYAQGIHLAIYGTPIFKEQIKAWNYGPVIPAVYGKFKEYASGGIPADPGFDPDSISEDMREFLDEIYKIFGQFSAVRLMDITHSDQCWKDAHPNGIITHKAMEKCLKKYLRNDKKT